MENKNITFCGCKTFRKTALNLIKALLVLIKKGEGSGLTPKYAEYWKVKREIKCGKNYRNNTM